jgi:hypothetical protein
MHPTFLQNPSHYTIEEFSTMLERCSFSSWKASFPTLHNTGVPSLAQWTEMGATPQERWGANLNRYYAGLGWHAGPHLVICPDYVWILSDLTQAGVSVSCWNSMTLGIEMVGNYEVGGDEFASGLGAKVRDNAAHVVALLAEKLAWSDLADFAPGEKGLHFHRECARDHHACPGSRVSKPDMLARIAALRVAKDAVNRPVSTVGDVSSVSVHESAPAGFAVENVQSQLNALGMNPKLDVDGVFGPATHAAVTAFQQAHNLADDWTPGTKTCALLSELAAVSH